MSVISWRSGRTDRVWRSATCAETSAMVDTSCFLCGINSPRCWETALLITLPDVMAGMVLGACAIDSKGSYDKMQHTVITSQG